MHGLTGCCPARRLHGSSRCRLRLHHAAQPLPARRPARPERRLGERDLRHGTVRCVGPPPHSIACPARPSLAIPHAPVSSLSCLPLPCNLTASLVIALLQSVRGRQRLQSLCRQVRTRRERDALPVHKPERRLRLRERRQGVRDPDVLARPAARPAPGLTGRIAGGGRDTVCGSAQPPEESEKEARGPRHEREHGIICAPSLLLATRARYHMRPLPPSWERGRPVDQVFSFSNANARLLEPRSSTPSPSSSAYSTLGGPSDALFVVVVCVVVCYA